MINIMSEILFEHWRPPANFALLIHAVSPGSHFCDNTVYLQQMDGPPVACVQPKLTLSENSLSSKNEILSPKA
jgi:hypothetical protein